MNSPLISPVKNPYRCRGEADQEVARASADDPTGRTFALGSDSDFFLFERCRYVRFDSLKVRKHLARRFFPPPLFAFCFEDTKISA